MIKFKQKEYSEYDAMRSLYVDLMKYSDRNKFDVIDRSSLIPILKGNNIVVERFVISTSAFGKDKYRMYLKIGAKAKLPDEVRLPNRVYDKKLGNLQINMNSGIFQKNHSTKLSLFSDNRPQQKKGSPPLVGASVSPYIDFSIKVQELLGDAIKYDKEGRTLVLEFTSIRDAIQALNILPFGLGYKIYLLDA